MARWNTVHVTTIDLTAWCFLRSWFTRLRQEGHRVTLVCNAGPFAADLEREGVQVVDVPMARSIHPVQDVATLARLVGVFRRLEPDFVHTHTSKAGFLGRLAASLAGVGHVIHTMHEPPHNAARNPLVRAAYIGLERLASHWAERVVTVSYANEQEIRARRLVDPGKLVVIREGLDLRRYPSLPDSRARIRALGIADGAPVIGTVARLETPKGHTYLLRAVQRLIGAFPDLRCVIVGAGHLRERLEVEARYLGVHHHVIFTGFRNDMLELLQGFDVFVLPSLWEGLGIVLLEAMAYQRPVVASRVGGVVDVVVDHETGLLVPPRAPSALAQAVEALLRDRARASAMGRAGYLRLVAEFRDDRANDQMLALYESLARRQEAPTR